MLAEYAYQDANRVQRMIDANDYNFTGTWSSSGTYSAATLDVAIYGQCRYIAIIDNVGGNPSLVPPRNIAKKWSPLVKIRDGDEPPFAPPATGTQTIAQLFTTGTDALYTAWSGTTLAYTALQAAWTGTDAANAALQAAWNGTNAAASAISLANQVLVTAWAGTNAIALANQALETAWAGTTALAALAGGVSGTCWASFQVAQATDTKLVFTSGILTGFFPAM